MREVDELQSCLKRVHSQAIDSLQAELEAARRGEQEAEERSVHDAKAASSELAEGKMEFIKAELGVSRAEEAAAAQEVVRLQYTVHHVDAEMNFMRSQIDMLQHQLFENNKQLGSLQAGILGYQRVVADLHAELAPSHENLQSLHAQLQDLQVLHQQSEAKASAQHSASQRSPV
ncbi:unnamed protein product [Lampetra planeri]